MDQKMSRVYPPKRKVLVIEWPDQRTVFQKHKGKDLTEPEVDRKYSRK